MSAPLSYYPSRDAGGRTFFDAAAGTGVSVASGSPSPMAPPPPVPPPPAGHPKRHQQSVGTISNAARSNTGSRNSSAAPRDKGSSSNGGGAAGGPNTKSSPGETHDTAALLQLHLQLSQHLQREQQVVSDADIIRALKRLGINNVSKSNAPEPTLLPSCASRNPEQQLRGKNSGPSYTNASEGQHGHGGSDRGTVPNAANIVNTSRGTMLGAGATNVKQGGNHPAPTAGNHSLTLRDRTSHTGSNSKATGNGPNLYSPDDMPQRAIPPNSQQNYSGQTNTNALGFSRGKQHQQGPSWRCRTCDAFNVGHISSRCCCCGKLQQPTHHNLNSHVVSQQHGGGRRSHHSHKQVQQQQSAMQQPQQHQKLQLQQLQRDVLLAAVSVAAAAAEKRADDKKAKRAAAAAAAAIASESHQQHAGGRVHGSQTQRAPYFAQSTEENLQNTSQNVGKEMPGEGVSGLTNASGGNPSSEGDASFESFLTENFLRQQPHGHMGSGRLLTEDGYEDSATAAAAAAAAAATLFPGLLQSLEHCSPTSSLLTKGLSSLHDSTTGRVQQQQVTRAGSDNTNGAVSTSHCTPLGMSSETLESFNSLEREGLGRVASCLSGDSGVAGSSAFVYSGNGGHNGTRVAAQGGCINSAGEGFELGCSTTDDGTACPALAVASSSFTSGVSGHEYGGPSRRHSFGDNEIRSSRLAGMFGSYQATGESVLTSAPGLTGGKTTTALAGSAVGGGITPFSAATLLAESETPLNGGGTTTGMNLTAFQDFASAPQSTLFGDDLTPGAESLNLLGDCRSLSSATPSSLLSNSESNSICNGGARVVHTSSDQRRSGAGELLCTRQGGEGNCRTDRCPSSSSTVTAGSLLVNRTEENRSANQRETAEEIHGRTRHSEGGRNATKTYSSGDCGLQYETARLSHGNNQGHIHYQTAGQQPQQTSATASAAVGTGTAGTQPFCHSFLQQQVLDGTRLGDSPQGGGDSDFSLTRTSLPLSSTASSPGGGLGAEEYSPLALHGGVARDPACPQMARLSGPGGLPLDPASLDALLPTFLSPVQILLLKSKEVADRLVEEFAVLGYGDPTGKAAEALRTSLAILGYTTTLPSGVALEDESKPFFGGGNGSARLTGNAEATGDRSKTGSGSLVTTFQDGSGNESDGGAGGVGEEICRKPKNANWAQGVGGPHFSAPTMLAHPDEFKNPSSFLKIYGDPMCAVAEGSTSSPQAGVSSLGSRGPRSGCGAVVGRAGEGCSGGSNLPIKGHNGNWVCDTCSNVNFPRRFRCNKCGAMRGPQGDAVVAEYAKVVYHQHLKTYRNLASRPGVDLPLKRLQGLVAGSIASSGAGGGGVTNGGTKKSSSIYCSPSSNGGSTTTNSITGSAPSTPSETANSTTHHGTVSNAGVSNGSSTQHGIANVMHPPGSESGRAGSRVSTAAHSSVGTRGPGDHRSQSTKGQPTADLQSSTRSTRSAANGNAGTSVSCCFPPGPSMPRSVAAALPQFHSGTAYDGSLAEETPSHDVGNSPRSSRNSSTKNNRVGRAYLSCVFPEDSPRTVRRSGNCNAAVERQRGTGGASCGQTSVKASPNVGENKSRRDPNVSSPNCSPMNRRPTGSSGEKDVKEGDVAATPVLSTEVHTPPKRTTHCTKQPPTNVETERKSSVQASASVAGRTQTDTRFPLDAKAETFSKLKSATETEKDVLGGKRISGGACSTEELRSSATLTEMSCATASSEEKADIHMS